LIGIERQGGFAPLVAVPANRLFPLADHIDDAVAAFAETLAVEVHLFRTQIPPLARNLLILGAGAQGLLALQLARMLNIADILVSDVEPERLRIAHELGATVTIDAREKDPVAIAKERTEGWGLEVAIDTSGSPAARIHGAQSLAPAGLLCLIGLGVGPTTVDMLPIVSREISIRGSYCYTDDDFARSLELLTDGSVRCDKLLSLAPLNAGPQEFEALIQSPGNRVKVLLQPQLNVG
ncbi:MAG TPA: zinc-binding dehydrogenase, partial [Chthonomonadales bacterium]|nr:zinc-binding dehydrogenase [Chthonomonadales bacterium]